VASWITMQIAAFPTGAAFVPPAVDAGSEASVDASLDGAATD
jgi:hypothetical protein